MNRIDTEIDLHSKSEQSRGKLSNKKNTVNGLSSYPLTLLSSEISW